MPALAWIKTERYVADPSRLRLPILYLPLEVKREPMPAIDRGNMTGDDDSSLPEKAG